MVSLFCCGSFSKADSVVSTSGSVGWHAAANLILSVALTPFATEPQWKEPSSYMSSLGTWNHARFSWLESVSSRKMHTLAYQNRPTFSRTEHAQACADKSGFFQHGVLPLCARMALVSAGADGPASGCASAWRRPVSVQSEPTSPSRQV